MTIKEELEVDLKTLQTVRENLEELITEDNDLIISVQLLSHAIDRLECSIAYMED